jgi:hypothetical protein
VRLEYLTDLRITAEPALSNVVLASAMAQVDASNAWAVFRAHLDEVAARTADELVPLWKGPPRGVPTCSPSRTLGPWPSRCGWISTPSVRSVPHRDPGRRQR